MVDEAEPLHLPIVASDELCSAPLHRFLREYVDALDFFFFTINLASGADEARMIAAKALAEGGSEEDQRRYDEILESPTTTFDKLTKFGWIQSRNLVLTVSNGYLCYLSEIIQEVMRRRPEVLRSSATIPLSDVLSFARYTDLISFLVDRQINEIAYGGLLDIDKYVSGRLGLDLFENSEVRDLLIILIESRNIYTHNRGIVNELFLKRVRNHCGFTFQPGRRFHVGMEDFIKLTENCIAAARRLDQRICPKFKVARKRYRSWQRPRRVEGAV
jgi:hypothetical protein